MALLFLVVVVVVLGALAGGFVVGARSRRWCGRCGGDLRCIHCRPQVLARP